jgi:hypothetical protein
MRVLGHKHFYAHSIFSRIHWFNKECPPIQKTGEVTMKTLVSWNQLVWECQARHQTSLFQPENCTEAAKIK